MEPIENRIVQRYFRKTIACPEGGVTHHGDCDFFSVFMCSCGLLADLRAYATERASELFPAFGAQLADHEATRMLLLARHVSKHPAPKKGLKKGKKKA